MADANGVTLYTTEPCSFCRQAKTLLESRGVDFSEVNLARDPEGRADLVALTGQMTFPQIVVGRRAIGGFRELVEADRDGRLEVAAGGLTGAHPLAGRLIRGRGWQRGQT